MRPSIITTINNADPSNPSTNDAGLISINNNGNSQSANKVKKASEPYESYIEDSFVGHWENEDDEDEYQEDFSVESHNSDASRSNLHHPSTFEFDFDSFGPESFIYTPLQDKGGPSQKSDISATTDKESAQILDVDSKGVLNGTTSLNGILSTHPVLTEVSPEMERKEEGSTRVSGSSEIEDGQQTRMAEEHLERNSSNDPSGYQTTERLYQQTRNLSPLIEIVDTTKIDLKVIEPYKKVISHAGYCHVMDAGAQEPPSNPSSNGLAPAVIVFSACYLPDRSRRDYDYVMDHLFLYILTSLHELIADDYIMIYLHNTQPSEQSRASIPPSGSTFFRMISPNNIISNVAPSLSSTNITSVTSSPVSNSNIDCSSRSKQQPPNNLPTFSWMKRCYQMIDRKLKKNLKVLYLVRPTFWLKTLVIMCKPFISAKFSKKIRFAEDMNALRQYIPVDKLIWPASAEGI